MNNNGNPIIPSGILTGRFNNQTSASVSSAASGISSIPPAFPRRGMDGLSQIQKDKIQKILGNHDVAAQSRQEKRLPKPITKELPRKLDI